jgi:hypothetical protein
MPRSQQEIREHAIQFSKEWENETHERAEAQSFWNDFFSVFGVSRRQVGRFEEYVKLYGKKWGSIDLLWKGVLIAEHKSKGEDLTKAYEQALDYFPGLREEEIPRYVIVTDFANFRLYDLETREEFDFTLKEFPQKIHLFGFVSGYKQRIYKDEDPVNIKVAIKLGGLHDALLESGYTGHPLEIFLVRLVYCLFADDTGIFIKDQFQYLIENRTKENGTDVGPTLIYIFQILNTPIDKRLRTLEEDLMTLPYVNGHLFSESLQIPAFDSKMRQHLLDCCTSDWSNVSPAIFGSLFQAVMEFEKQELRHNLGAHYTSEKNILKVVRGLFLDDLQVEFEKIKFDQSKLRAFQKKLSLLRFFDPACGCGNFLVIIYREIRLLELEVIRQIRHLSGDTQLIIDVTELSNIDVDIMYGIEIEEFPVRVAQVALWLTDHQMNMLLSAEFGLAYARLPLKKTPNIINANSLREDWNKFLSAALQGDKFLYTLGNPPFVAKHLRTDEQTSDMEIVCKDIKNWKTLDYVCAWYVKAAQLIEGTQFRVAFVSTNSITQGEQVAPLWQYLLNKKIKVHFAHRTFKWANEAKGVAQVFCVIIGFATLNLSGKKIYDYASPNSEPMEKAASNINPYLVDADDIVIPSRDRPICPVPEMLYGSKPADGGHLLLTTQEKGQLLELEPRAEKYIRPILSASEFINGELRWCLWLKGISPSEWRALPRIVERVEAVRKFRSESPKAETRELSKVPYLFAEVRQPESDYILIPIHSSENRRFIPMGFFPKDVIVSNSCSAIPNATIYHFGVITSTMHMAWMRQVCGRIKSDYRYSINLVYNNFPWPEQPKVEQIKRVEKAAQAILDARNLYINCTLADLYDPLSMPKELIDAHTELDKAVDRCYRPALFTTGLNRLEFLFGLYKKYTEPLIPVVKKRTHK